MTGMAAGALFASVPAVLRVYWNTNEIVVTLMMNYIAINLTNFLVKEYFLTSGIFGDSLTTDELLPSARFPRVWHQSHFLWIPDRDRAGGAVYHFFQQDEKGI